MIFDWHDPDITFDQAPYTLRDDMNREIDLPVVWLDTETGEVRSFTMSKDGGYFENPEGTLVLNVAKFMAPLRVFARDGSDISAVGLSKNFDEPLIVGR